MLINVILYNTELHLNKAKAAHKNGNDEDTLEQLGILYDLLDDVVGSGARDKCESAESSKTD